MIGARCSFFQDAASYSTCLWVEHGCHECGEAIAATACVVSRPRKGGLQCLVRCYLLLRFDVIFLFFGSWVYRSGLHSLETVNVRWN